jgi:3-hydroxybutyryl-CoA dehydrogenase
MADEHVLVVGAGQMGAGIAQVALTAGCRVTLVDVAQDAVDRGAGRIRGGLKKLREKGKLDEGAEAAALKRLSLATSAAEAREVDVAIEAATENEELKRRIFQELDRVVRPGGVLATNTSSIPITRIAATTKRPEAVIGMHFMNPVPVMQLVELIRGAATSDATYERTAALARTMGVVTSRLPGVHRQPHPHPHAQRGGLCPDGGLGTPGHRHRDEAGTNQPMGPLELPTYRAGHRPLHRRGCTARRPVPPCPLPASTRRAGWLGKVRPQLPTSTVPEELAMSESHVRGAMDR